MIGSLFSPSPADRRLLRTGALRGPTTYVIAIMTFAMVLIAAVGLALANAAGVVATAAEHRYVAQLPDGRQLAAAVSVLRSTAGVTDIEPVPEAEMRRTLERWVGPAGLGDDLPLPALIHFDLAPEADPAAIAAALERRVAGGRMVAERATLQPLTQSLRALQWTALVLVLLMAVAASAAVVLAARGALDTHRPTVEIMHGVGATDQQIAGMFQRKIALDALGGSLAGGAIAAFVLLLIAQRGGGLAGDLAGRAPLDGGDLLLLFLLPLAAVVIATLVARAAVLGALRKAP